MNQKNILILGANGFIGQALQDKLNNENYIYCLDYTYTNEKKESNSKYQVKLDITKEEDVVKFSQYLEKNNIQIDAIVNLVGINTMSSFYNITDQDWDRTFDLNVKSYVFFLKAIYSSFAKQVAIVNVASQNGIVGHEERIAYGPSKAALIQLTRNLSIDFLKDRSRDIKINSVSPSYIKNESNESYLNSVEGKKLLQKIPYKKFVSISDVVNVITFLISSESDAIRGQNIVVDYGYTII
ncbi:SDR family oxidoreductase [Priestia megaterium]|uniref:SDR family oxidoreductase n=1 Tax=Priestia megaterium TaxID=1404 RepID=UPI00159C7CED|nr:SDR family oxidoreductase [Priestia megaterium]